MTLVLLTWCPDPTKPAPCANMPCQPSHPPTNGTPPTWPPGSLLPPFTEAAVNINQVQIVTDLRGKQTSYSLGSMIIYSAADGIPPQGGFGVPLVFGPPETSSVASAVLVYQSRVQILHPYYPPGSYDGSLPDISTGLTPTVSAGDGSAASNQAASVVAGNAAIAQATQIVG